MLSVKRLSWACPHLGFRPQCVFSLCKLGSAFYGPFRGSTWLSQEPQSKFQDEWNGEVKQMFWMLLTRDQWKDPARSWRWWSETHVVNWYSLTEIWLDSNSQFGIDWFIIFKLKESECLGLVTKLFCRTHQQWSCCSCWQSSGLNQCRWKKG